MNTGLWVRYAVLLSLCVGYGALWFLARHPRVDELYRSYYVDRNLRHWPSDPRIRYRAGTLIDFSEPSPYLSRHGWAEPDASGVWMIERVAELFLVLDAGADRALALQFDASAYVPSRYPRTTVETSINGIAVGRQVFRDGRLPQRANFPVPVETLEAAPPFGRFRVVRVAFAVLHPGPPFRFSSSRNRKMRGLHLSRLCLHLAGQGCLAAER